ncbi:amidase signature domain-containing protein [Clohesyomyces aquaticus]|uniref:Amidase signature domain-containing protein n=1 Tax=Clohesyomyces aquaticus TaxID=1231657 RepID=A0A1Y1ZV05_9PLEO|nr:amidase signature domain-containing protein [Clohesyomyces aquaticus]
MSVFSITPKPGNPVTETVFDDVCASLHVKVKDSEKDDYRKLLAVFHESAEELMAMPDFEPEADLTRFPRENVHFPDKKDNEYGAWAWRVRIQDQTLKEGEGLLAGKTVALKDNIAVKDVPMLLGTEFVKGYVPKVDATVVTRVLEAGATVEGKAVCENLCHSATSHSAATGAVENPRAKGYSSGGSSSGCGVLVALGEIDLAIGADQGGSVRIPACNCGIVGFKPTFGLIPYTACGSNEPTNDHLGPMTRTVLDNALLLQAIAGSDNIDDRGFAAPPPSGIPRYYEILKGMKTPKDLTGVRIGIISESLLGDVVDRRVRKTFLRAAEGFKDLGAIVEDVSIPIHKKGPAIWTGVSKVGGYLNKTSGAYGRRGHQMWDLNALMHPLQEENWNDAYVSLKNIYFNGAYAATAFPFLLAKATNLSRQLRAAYDAALKKYDILITPTLPYIATSHAPDDATPLDQIAKQVGLTSNTCQFNQTGHPALTMPCGLLEIVEGPLASSGSKLPVGLQLIGRWWAEETVLHAAYAWELGHNWESM